MKTPTFDELVDRFFYCDSEIFAHDSLFVFISHKTKKRFVFHNSLPNELRRFLDTYNPILVGYNINGYDKWILKCWLAGYTPEELKEVNDYIINGGNGWEIDCEDVDIPTCVDLMNCIVPRKSLKELEGNLRLNITETTVPFDLPTKWTRQQYEEVLYYCTCDVEALIPIFNMLIGKFKSKYIIARLGKIDPEYGISLTDANLTAVLLGAKRQNHDDPFKYEYPEVINKNAIPKHVLDYFDDVIEHNDLNYKVEAPAVRYGNCLIQLGYGGLHGAKETTFSYDRGDTLRCVCCEYKGGD